MVCDLRSVIGLAQSDLSVIQSLDVQSVADSSLLLAVVACAAASCAAVAITSLHARAKRVRSAPPSLTPSISPIVSPARSPTPHSALIEELLRTARIAHREGLGALSHPLNRSPDPDVQYAIDLVCSRADPRIVRGVLAVRTQDAHTSLVRPPLRTRFWLSLGSAALLVGVCALWVAAWIVDETLLNNIGGGLFAGWCITAALWCFSLASKPRPTSRATNAGSCPATAICKHDLILAAAECLARGDAPDQVERTLRACQPIVPHVTPIHNAA